MKIVLIPLLTMMVLVTACTPMTASRGNLLDDYQMKEIQPGVDTRDEVIRKIGSPTTIAPFDDNTWYYMGQKTEKSGIMDPKIEEERIVVVTFAEDGLVDKIVERKDGREDIPITQRHTPTTGNDFTFMQQMMGNLGKFNKSGENAAATAGGGSVNR
jgi:outer membrane protein assembly factor BamE (lipoprotein component of BamABCDE complex)